MGRRRRLPLACAVAGVSSGTRPYVGLLAAGGGDLQTLVHSISERFEDFRTESRETIDNAAVVIYRPMGRFVYSGSGYEWPTEPGIFTSTSFDFEEAVG